MTIYQKDCNYLKRTPQYYMGSRKLSRTQIEAPIVNWLSPSPYNSLNYA